MIDPHTADGIKAALDHIDQDIPMIVLETALPIKFEQSILEATGRKPERPEGLKDIELLKQKLEILDNDVDLIRLFIREKT